jgi:hypothetical protein
MARRDKIHHAVKNALIRDGWEITADPYHIKYKDVELEADLGADRTIAAERKQEKIAVEIKSFLRPSAIHELQAALGQYQMYEVFLKLNGSERELYLAVSLTIWEQFFLIEAVADLIEKMKIRILVVDLTTEEIKLWKT